MDFPKAPGAEARQIDEAMRIIDETLIPMHRKDPLVLRFIDSYVHCRNKAQAAREAGLVDRAGATLYNRPDINSCIMRLTALAAQRYGYDANEPMERMKELGDFDPLDLVKEDGTFRKMHEIAPHARRVIKKLKVKNFYETDPNGMRVWVGEIIEYEIYDKQDAWKTLGREKNIMKDTKVIEHDVTTNMANVLLDRRTRAEKYMEMLESSRDVTTDEKE